MTRLARDHQLVCTIALESLSHTCSFIPGRGVRVKRCVCACVVRCAFIAVRRQRVCAPLAVRILCFERIRLCNIAAALVQSWSRVAFGPRLVPAAQCTPRTKSVCFDVCSCRETCRAWRAMAPATSPLASSVQPDIFIGQPLLYASAWLRRVGRWYTLIVPPPSPSVLRAPPQVLSLRSRSSG
jgi:hypothetical protein